jgi:zinc transport system ATP-binding protein
MRNDSLIEFNQVSKIYNKKLVIDNISFGIPRNSIITLIGPNGAGKTTIAKLILGSEQPTSGAINKAPGISFGYVPQKININTNLPLNVANLLETFTNSSWRNSDILEFAQIDTIKNHDISSISGGQMSRVLLAICLINKANLIILDEPTKELDTLAQSYFYHLIEDIKQNFGVTIFMISHDLHTVIKASDQVLCLNHHLCCYGKPTEQYHDILNHVGFYKHRHNHIHD